MSRVWILLRNICEIFPPMLNFSFYLLCASHDIYVTTVIRYCLYWNLAESPHTIYNCTLTIDIQQLTFHFVINIFKPHKHPKMYIVYFVPFVIFVLLLVPSSLSVPRNRTARTGRRSTRNVKDGTIRLVGGKTSREGNVEIYHLGQWGSICDDEWDLREANIACRILGFPNATRATHNSEYGRGRREYHI